MALSRPTLQTIVDRIAADMVSKISGATTLALRSVLRVLARAYAGATHLNYGYLDNVVLRLFVATSSGTWLEKHGSELGVARNAAVASTGVAQATGTTGTNIPAGTELQSASGNIYTTDTAVVISAGVADLDITAETAGDDSNEDAAAELTFTSPIVSVDTTATVDSDGLTGGTDEEEDEAYRQRILDRKQKTPQGGAERDYEAWTREVAGVTRVWTIPQYQGIGTIAVFFVRDDDPVIFPGAAEIADVREHLISHVDASGRTVGIPVTAEPGLFVLAPEAQTQDMSIEIYPNTAAVQATVEAALEDLVYRDGGPGETVYLSSISEAISAAAGESRHRIISPVADISVVSGKLLQVGTITWGDYS